MWAARIAQMNVQEMQEWLADFLEHRNYKTVAKHRQQFQQFKNFAREQGHAVFPPPPAQVFEAYHATLRSKTRSVPGQEGVVCSSVVVSFKTTARMVYEKYNNYTIPTLFAPLEFIRDEAHKAKAPGKFTRPKIEPGAIVAVIKMLKDSGEDWQEGLAFLLQLNIVGMCRYFDATQVDLAATIAVARFHAGLTAKAPEGYLAMTREKGFDPTLGSWGLRFKARKGDNQPSWCRLGKIKDTPLFNDLLKFVARFGVYGGLARKITRTGGSRIKNSTRHFEMTQQAVSYDGDFGWANIIKWAFKEANQMQHLMPEDGEGWGGITPHGMRKLGASLTASHCNPETGKVYQYAVNTQVAEAAGGWAMNGVTFAAVYQDQFTEEVTNGLKRRMMGGAGGGFGADCPVMDDGKSTSTGGKKKAKPRKKANAQSGGGASTTGTRVMPSWMTTTNAGRQPTPSQRYK